MDCRGWDDVKEEQLMEALWGDLSWSNRQKLDQLLPTEIKIPSGRNAALDYQNDDIVLSVNGVSGLSNFQVVEMLRKGQGVFTLVVISGQQVSAGLKQQTQQAQQAMSRW